MKKIYNRDLVKSDFISNRKKSTRLLGWLSMCLMFLMGTLGFAQTIQIGTGTSTNSNVPLNYNWGYNYSQTIYTSAQMSAAGASATGTITKLRFKPTAAVSTSLWKDWVVYIGNTSKTAFGTTTDWVALGGLTEVFNGTILANTVANQWIEISFSTPFVWTGGNIVIAVDENTADYGANPLWASFTSAANASIYYRSDGTNPDPTAPGTASGRSNIIAQIQFDGTLQAGCSGTPVGGTASLSSSTGNSGSTFTTSVSGATSAAGLVYQWQKFISGAWQDIAGATTTSAAITAETGSVGTATNYRLKVTCTNSGEFAYSSEVTHTLALVYCTPTYTNGCSNGATLNSVVTTSGVTNFSNTATGCTGGFTSYTATKQMSVAKGTSFTIAAGVSAYAGGVKVWIDYNQNGTFDNDELATSSAATIAVGSSHTASISVPLTALSGVTRMRVRVVEGLTTFTACDSQSYGEAEDYQITLLAPPSCLPPSALVASNLTFTSADLSWTSAGTSFDVEWGVAGFAQGSGTTIAGISSNQYVLNGLTAETSYSFYVRNLCGGGNGNSIWAGPFTFFTGYCIPTGSSNSYRITGVSTTGGFTNISNLANGTSSPYNNYSAMSVSQSPGQSINYTVNTSSSTGIKIWVDLNKDLIFDANELVVSHLTYSATGTWTGLIPLPSDMPLGDYRMRIRSNYYTYTFDACGAAQFGYGEAEDYTLSVVTPPSCLPPSALSASNVGFTSADLSWTSTGTAFDLEYGVQGFVQGAGTTVNTATTSYEITGLTQGTSYSYYVRNICGGDDGNSSWSGPFTFATLNKASVIWTQTFATTTLPAGWVNSGFTLSTTTALATGATTNYIYKNLWESGATANFQTVYVGDLGTNDRLKFNYKLANYDSPYGAPAIGSGNFIVEIQQYPSATWTVLETVSNNGIVGWQEISYNLAEYAGEIVKIKITGNWTSGDYYLAFDNFMIDPTPCPEWTGAVSTAWNVAGNWCDNTVPSALTNVIINSSNPAIISSDVTVASITLGASANVTVNGTLNVGNISVASGGMMTVANDAAILQTNGATNTGLVTVKRNSHDLFRQDYTLWSSPVTGQNLRAFSTQTLFNRFSSYNTTDNAYLQEIVTTADMNTKTFTNAKGYLIRMPNNWVEVGGSAQSYSGSFTGNLNNGNVSIALSGDSAKLNLVGNPYPSPISIAALFAANSNIVQNTLYFWRKKASATSGNVASGYATYTSMGIVSADASINGTTPTNIEVGQGFFVIANSVTPGNLVFNNTMRNNGAATFYKSSNDNTAELHRFWLNLSNATNVVGQTLIGYKTGATQGIDSGVDALYFNDSQTALTSLINNTEYIIQGRNVPFVDTDIVPLGFKSDVAGSFTIGLSNFDGLFAENQAIYLKDNVSGTLHNLKLSDYTFTTSIGVFNNRFEVQYSSTLGTNNPELAANSILIGVKDQKININAGTITMDKIELIDVAGRVIYTKEGVNATTTTLENVVSSNQMLIVRISTKENGVVNKKIIF